MLLHNSINIINNFFSPLNPPPMKNILKQKSDIQTVENSPASLVTKVTEKVPSEIKEDTNILEQEELTLEEDGGTPIYYTAQKNDTVYSITKQFSITQDDFKRWNTIGSNNLIVIGKQYIVGYKNSANLSLVIATVGSTSVGTVTTRSYDDDSYLCEVPLYEVILKSDGGDKIYGFKALRYGLAYKWQGQFNSPTIVGLSQEKSYTIQGWLPNYLSEIPGFPKGAYVIEGAHYFHSGNTKDYHPVAVVGCIGINGEGEWVRFCSAVKALAGTNDENAIIKAKKFIVKVVGAVPPLAANLRKNPNRTANELDDELDHIAV